ncbi:hypothetical protein IVA79_08255 [Bradyrhizobium sp. 138]|nr:hypothetical protein [Bradyrhizobium sp. 138]
MVEARDQFAPHLDPATESFDDPNEAMGGMKSVTRTLPPTVLNVVSRINVPSR